MKRLLSLFVCAWCLIAWKAPDPRFKDIDAAVNIQQYQKALEQNALVLRDAEAKKDTGNWTRALIRRTLLRQGLHGYETAVNEFRAAAWPDDTQARAMLNLFYAETLLTYYQGYRYEIDQRERLVSTREPDLKKWDRQKLFTAIDAAFAEVWNSRDSLDRLQVADFPEFITPGGYPPGVRSSLRDFVTYRWTEFLNDSSLWSARHQNEVYLLSLNDLLDWRRPEKTWTQIHWIDEETPPLLKISALLDELHAFHAGRGEKEAVLESELQRTRVFKNHFTQEVDQAVLRDNLARVVDAERNIPWWSMGRFELASLHQNSGDLVKARLLALEGAKAYPGSAGGLLCAALVHNIELPDFQIQAMGLDRPGVRSVQIDFKNIPKLYFRAYAIDFPKSFEEHGWEVFNAYSRWQQDIVKNGKPVTAWSVDLPPTTDFKSHRQFLIPKLPGQGLFIIAASAREDFSEQNNRVEAFQFLLSPLVLTSRQSARNNGVEVWVKNGEKGDAAGEVSIDLYQIDTYNKAKRLKSVATDAAGYAKIDADAWNLLPNNNRNVFLVARRGATFTFDPSVFYLYKQSEPSTATSGVFIYTDRSFYRPEQKLHFKIVAYRGDSATGKFHAQNASHYEVIFADPNGQEIARKTVVTNRFGSAAGEFEIPKGRLLGSYHLNAGNGAAQVQVEEYKRPTFEVQLQPPKNALRLNQPATIDGKATYYFGLPLSQGEVAYRVFRQVRWPWWFGWRYFWWNMSAEEQQIAAGKTKLKADGSFSVGFKPQADENAPDKKALSYVYRLEAEVTADGGETRSATSSYAIGFVAVTAAFQTERGFVAERDGSADIKIRRSDLSGVAKAGAATLRLYRLKQGGKVVWPAEVPLEKRKQTDLTFADDLLRPRWEAFAGKERTLFGWKDDEKLSEQKLQHDVEGMASFKLPPLTAGAYRLRYATKDDFGETFETQYDFVVGGAKASLKLPVYVYVEKPSVTVGESARLYVGGGDSGQAYLFEIYKRNHRLRRETHVIGRDTQVIEIPVDETMRGGFTVMVSLLHDYQMYSEQAQVYVPWDNKQLQVSFETFRDRLRPGQSETWTVAVKGPKHEAVSAELLAYMYDRSLDFFGPHSYPSAGNLYGGEYSSLTWRSGLRALSAMMLWNSNFANYMSASMPAPDALHRYDGYPIGGVGSRHYFRGGMMPMAAMAKEAGDRMEEMDAAPALQKSVSRTVSREKKARDTKTAQPPQGQAELRSNFSESAFFKPHLLTDSRGISKIEFRVPDSVTSWNVFVHAMTEDLKFGTLRRETKSAKDLMVRPYLPRFLREGDAAVLRIVVDNTTDKAMSGDLQVEITQAESGARAESLFGLKQTKQAWKVDAKKSASLEVALQAPSRVGSYAVKVTAKGSGQSDGELRMLPVLPGRVHLIQSRFATLKNDQKRVLELQDLKNAAADPSLIHEDLVVTLDAQLFYGVLKAVPYLVSYPYECLEQTLNRFLSTGILSSLYERYPAVSSMARKFSKRETQAAAWTLNDPNRKMALEELPWVQTAKGGDKDNLINVLDARIAKAQRQSALAKIQEAQLPSGAWPWFAGGPASPYITLYLLDGFAKAANFKVDVPKSSIQRGWKYMSEYYRDYLGLKFRAEDWCYSFITYLNYVLSSYPDKSYYDGAFSDAERQDMLNYSFAHWKLHNPYSKALLALTLQRMNRGADARLVMASIMDSAISREDEGTHWAQEDRSWLWYNDTIESQAFILRALLEVDPKNPKIDGVVLWLFLNKKLNQWKSTRATAEVIYSLVQYLKATDAFLAPEQAKITLASQSHEFIFKPDEYSGEKNQIVIPGEKVTPVMASVAVDKTGKGVMFASMTWHYSTEKMPQDDRGDFLAVSRTYYLRENAGGRWTLKPLKEGATVKIGDQVEVQVSIRAKHPCEYVHLRDPRAAGFEPEHQVSGHRWDLGIVWYEEIRDSGANFFFEQLPVGEYTFKYRLRAAMAGRFKAGPATLQSMYAPEFAAFSSGATLDIGK